MPLGVDSRKMINKINWEGLCILITVLESSGGNSFLVTHNLTQNRTCTLLVAVGQYSWGIRVLQPWPFLLFSLGMSAVLGSFCPSLLLCLSPSKFQIPRRTDVPLQLTAAPLCSCLPGVSFIISGSSDGKLASASRRSWSIAQRIWLCWEGCWVVAQHLFLPEPPAVSELKKTVTMPGGTFCYYFLVKNNWWNEETMQICKSEVSLVNTVRLCLKAGGSHLDQDKLCVLQIAEQGSRGVQDH